MPLTADHKDNIRKFLPVFKTYLDDTGQDYDLDARDNREKMYEDLLSPEAIQNMTELEFGKVISSLWASRIWGNKTYLVNKLIDDNSLDTLKQALHNLLWGEAPLAKRYNAFKQNIKGLGPASMTELLAFVHPDECGLWNKQARAALEILGMQDIFPAMTKSQISGKEYTDFNQLLGDIQTVVNQTGDLDLNLLGIDYFLYSISQQEQEASGTAQISTTSRPSDDDFDHDEIIDHLVAIGQRLGFDAEKEFTVATGARVDAIWQARIANLGVVTYVFEVQRRGSIDSLILNLQRAQNNASVQRVVVVANPDMNQKIKAEIETLPESFRKAVRYMKVSDVNRAAEMIEELFGIIDSLELAQNEFGI